MPKRLPLKDILTGLVKTILKALRFWLHSTLVAFSWLAIVPLTACRIYRCLFAGSMSSMLTLPLDMLSTENVVADILQGCFVVLCSLGAFISLVWLREQILSGGGPEWLNAAQEQPVHPQPANQNRLNQNNQRLNHENNNDAINGNNRPEMHNNLNGDQNERNNNDNQQQAQVIPQQHQNNVAAAAQAPPLNARPPPVVQPAAAAADDNHWNPMEWDRAAEDLTWDRLLGLDGSLLFLEHVFWVISLNTLFILGNYLKTFLYSIVFQVSRNNSKSRY
jgi:E3 ubiquitin-protein ligase MARCH6